MEVVEISGSSAPITADCGKGDNLALDRVRIKRKTLQTVLEQCQRALESLSADEDADAESLAGSEADDGEGSSEMVADREADELCDRLQSRFECPDFLEKLESVHQSVPPNMSEEGNSWDVISKSDIWDDGNTDLEHDDYFLVSQEDIVDSIACFMAAYLLSLKETKELSPNQLQDALSKTFSVKKKKGKLRKAWDGSKVIYNVVSWGATAVGIYQNPALVRVASDAFCASCRVISKLL